MVESTALGLSTQLVWLHFDIVHWFFPSMLHSCLMQSQVHFPYVTFDVRLVLMQVLKQIDV
jgi:hypothetical protein